jgi:hypothetical protein
MACHCRGCQKLTASAFSLSAAIPVDAFRVTGGDPVIGGLHGPNQHYFCSYCMSWLFTRPAGLDVLVNVRTTMLDDLETALNAVLERSSADGEVTVRLRVDDGSIRAAVGPLAVDRLRAELESDPGDAVTLRRILDTVVDRYELDQDGWLELSKDVEPKGDRAGA